MTGIRKWDTQYAEEVFGPVFGDVQKTANDRFWKSYFKHYIAMAQAVEAELSAAEMHELLKITLLVARTGKLLSAYLEKTPFEGRQVGAADIKASVSEARHAKTKYEAGVSMAMKARLEYLETMAGVEQVAARAAMVGVK